MDDVCVKNRCTEEYVEINGALQSPAEEDDLRVRGDDKFVVNLQ